MDMTERLQFPK